MKEVVITACADRKQPCPHFRSTPRYQCVIDPQNPVAIEPHVAVAEIRPGCPLPNWKEGEDACQG